MKNLFLILFTILIINDTYTQEADLIIENIITETNSALGGSQFYFAYDLKNQGDGIANSSRVKYYLSDDIIFDDEDTYKGKTLINENILASESNNIEASVYLSISMTEGEYYILIIADGNYEVSESDEENNINYFSFEILPDNPDLLIPNISVFNTTDTINIGEDLNLFYQFANWGTGNASASNTNFFLSEDSIFSNDDISMASLQNTEIEALTSVQIYQYLNIPTNIPEGIYYIFAIVDFENTIIENNEENNMNFVEIFVHIPVCDLLVNNFVIENSNVFIGSDINFSFEVQNNGDKSSSQTNMVYYLSQDNNVSPEDIILSNENLGILNGESFLEFNNNNFNISDAISAGDYYLIISLDPIQFVEEINETNNTSVVLISINTTEPDLLIQNITTNNDTVNINDIMLLNLEIINQGSEDIANDSEIHYFLSENLIYDDEDFSFEISTNCNPLNSTEIQNIENLELNMPDTTEGIYYLILINDFLSEIDSENNENNIQFYQIYINIPKSDLVIQNLEILYNTNFLPADEVHLSFDIKNIGFINSEITNLKYFLSEDNIYDDNDILIDSLEVPVINSNEFISSINQFFTITEVINSGVHYLIFILDKENSLNEENENNNIDFVEFYIIPTNPDIVIQNVNTNNDTINVNENILINYEIVNQGSTNVESFKTSIYLSEDENFEEDLDIILLDVETDILNAQDTAFYNDIEITIPNGTIEGDYYIILKTDNENVIIESDEENNLSFYEIFVNEPKADLNIENFILNNEEYFLGEEINFSFEIQNLGDLESGITNFVYCLSQDSLFDDEDLILNDFALQVIEENDYIFFENEIINIPESDTGNYYLLIVLDENENITEENENNNSAFYQIHISELFSDLIIENVNLDNEIFYNGDNFNLSCNVKNIGDIVSDTTYLKMYISQNNIFDENDDILLNNVFVDSLQKDSILFYEINSNIPEINAGNYYLFLVVDNDNFVEEENENNNLYLISISILESTKDLTLSNFFLENSNVSLGEYANVNYTIKNLGNGLVPNNLLAFYLSEDNEFSNSDIPMGSVTIENLYAYGEEEGEINLMMPSFINVGDWKIIAIVDANEQVEETNEENNSEYLDILIDEIDLKIINALVTPTDLSAGQTIYINCELNNDGNTNSGNTNLKYYFSENASLDENDLLIHQKDIDNLEAEEVLEMNIVNFDIPETTLNGDYFILLIIDHENEISESNENNNFLSLEFTVLDETSQIPNLIFNSYSLFPNEINIGGEININFEIANYGIGESYASDIQFYLSNNFIFENETDILLDELSINSLGVNEIFNSGINFTIPLNLDSGVWFIIAIIDIENQIIESNESDNMFFVSFHLSTTTLPDLEIQNFYFTPSNEEIYANEKIEIFCDIKNIGDTISENCLLIYYLSKDNILDFSEDIEVAADLVSKLNNDSISKENTEIAIPYLDEESDWYLILFVDANEEIRELNEKNNILLKKIHIFPPDAIENINSKFNFSVYPNPSNSYFSIELEKQNFEKINLEIYDAFGRKIISEKIVKNSYKKEFDISNFQKGIYYLKIGDKVKKLIIN